MKTLFRIFAVLFVLLLLALVGGYFILTNASFQKSLVERQLPTGSSIESIHVTTAQVTLSGLVLMLPDGTRVEVGTVDTAFEPLAAVFDQTIKMGVLQVEGLRVDLPTVTEPTVAASPSTAGRESRVETGPSTPAATKEEASTNPMKALNALGNFEWLLDIDGIDFEGEIHDGQGSIYVVRVDSLAIRPGESSTIDASLQLLTDAPLPSGLKACDSTATLSFKQKAEGGFESLQLELKTSGADAQGQQLISVQQALELEVDDTAGVATVSVTFNAELPKPQVIATELAILGALQVTGNAVASTDGETMTLSAANLTASAAGAELVALDLKRSMVFGGKQDLSGDLLDITITALQLEWLNPWLPGLQVQSQAPVSLALSVAGAADGALVLTFAEALQLGPLTVRDADGPLLQDVVVMVAPELQLSTDQSLKYGLNSLSVADKYGSFIQGNSSGVVQLDATRDAANPFAGVQAQMELQIGLQEVFQLPVLAESASIVSGQLSLDVSVDASADEPLQLQAKIKGLRARSLPSMIRDYDLSLGLSHTSNPGELKFGANLLAGPASRPSTDVRFDAVVNPGQQPVTFSAEVSSPRVTQEDISILSAAFTPREREVIKAPTLSRPSAARGTEQPQTARGVGVDASGPEAPEWAMLNGRVSISIDEFLLEAGQIIESIKLKALVSEPKLSLDSISAKIGEGELMGSSTVLYAPSQAKPYSLSAEIRFAGIDPVFFVKKHKSAPVQGEFDGVFQVTGVGESLDAAVEDSTATLKITAEEGVLTAFELDERQQLGLGLAGLLGQSLDRPGIAALSHTIPYFKDIPFDSFVFELTRGADKRVIIPQLRLTGKSVLLDASGSVSGSRLSEVMDQALDLTVTLGAKGKLTKYLETLELLQATTAEDGFRRWNQDIQITGSLADPDTGGLMDILNDAAKGAFSTSNKRKSVPAETDPTQQLSTELVPQVEGTAEAAAEPAEPQKKSKEERRRDEIEMGLDLLNSFFGN
ncbi:MAG: hypothetical protein ABS34_05335 [Opitutaceae bacterium BACL24 MAG-120322-bin51]|jgi:hypothetical protein|nr:MAG: hypothetical protein ABS34_05335 [Opitutaceae bacterium BACL24 MAG-120322-bin51]